jgi:hypothetical protein
MIFFIQSKHIIDFNLKREKVDRNQQEEIDRLKREIEFLRNQPRSYHAGIATPSPPASRQTTVRVCLSLQNVCYFIEF